MAFQLPAGIELDTFHLSDIQGFDAAYGLSSPSIKQVYVGGKSFKLKDQGEATTDLEWAHALAPGAALQVYYLKSNVANKTGWKQFATAVQTAVKSGATAISISIGSCWPMPSPLWQITPQLGHHTYRWVPDVSFDADVYTGLRAYYKGGTSPGWPPRFSRSRPPVPENIPISLTSSSKRTGAR